MIQGSIEFERTPNQIPVAVVGVRRAHGREVLGPVVLSRRGVELISQSDLTISQVQCVLCEAVRYFEQRCPELMPSPLALHWVGGRGHHMNVQIKPPFAVPRLQPVGVGTLRRERRAPIEPRRPGRVRGPSLGAGAGPGGGG